MFIGAENGKNALVRRPFMPVPENGTLGLLNTMPNLYSEQMIKTLMKPQLVNNTGNCLWVRQQEYAAMRGPLEEVSTIPPTAYHKVHLASSMSTPQVNLHFQPKPDQSNALNLHSKLKSDELEKLHPPTKVDNPLSSGTVSDKSKSESEGLSVGIFDFPSFEGCNVEKMAFNPLSPQSLAEQLAFLNQNQTPSAVDIPQSDSHIVNGPLPQLDMDEWMRYSSESNNLSEIYSSINIDGSNSVSVADPSFTSSAILDECCTLKERKFQNPSDCMVSNLSTSQDVQSQVTSASLAESNAFSLHEFQDNSGVASSSHVDFDESSFLPNNSSWVPVAPKPARRRTYTKVYSGNVFPNYYSYD